MSEEDKKFDKNFEGTMVDLGEDLLESSGTNPQPDLRPRQNRGAATAPQAQPGASLNAFNLQEEIQRGEIFFAERLFDDAKKTFRKILRHEPNNSTAKKYLEDIQKLELQDLLGGEAPRKRLGSPAEQEEDPSRVLEQLEKELRISIEKSEIKPVPDLFENQETYERYRVKILETSTGLVVRDRIDIGVAHLEMGLFDIAQGIFESVVRYDEYRLSGMYLLGLSLIYGGKAIEATIRLEPLCRDLTLAEGPKTDFLYLMGLAFERLNDIRKAREFYRRVFTLNPRYRDVTDKLK